MTIKEIAKLAGVSPATVSRVINNSGYVKDEVRKRVQNVIDETGYRPNPFAKALHQNKSQTIGVILPKINASSSGDTVAGITDYFSEKGYSLLLGNTNHSVEKELEFFQLFKEKMVDGIILIATVLTPKHKEVIKKSKIPTVIVGQESLDTTPCVIFDEVMAAKEMVDFLIESGRKRIAFIGVDEIDVAVGVKRREGYVASLREHSLSLRESYIQKGDFTVESGYEACRLIWETSEEKPDAVFAVTDKMAIGAMNYFFEKDIRIPEDVAVCGMGGGFISKYFHPKLTTAFYDFKAAGMEGAKLLFDIISMKKISAKKIVMNHTFVKRESAY